MGTRYTSLREAVANLAAPADFQVAYLDRLFASVTDGGSAEPFGNDELALEFEDSFISIGAMLNRGEVTRLEVDALESIDGMLARWGGKKHSDFWRREALYDDARWHAIRVRASEVLAMLPKKPRESDDTRDSTGEGNGS